MAHRSIETVQINLHHSKSASAILCRTLAKMQTAIALSQELWLVDGTIRGLGGCGKLLYVNPRENRIRACILIKGIDATFLPRLSKENLAVAKVKALIRENRVLEFMIGSAYLSYDFIELPPTPEVQGLINRVRDGGLELLLGCDANSHHLGWGSSNTNAWGEALHDFMMGNGLLLLNRGNEPAFMDCRRQELLDITMCTTGMADLVRDWRVSREASGSDHSQIRLSLTDKVDPIQRRNPRNTNWVGYKAELSLRIQDVTCRFENKERLEYAAECFGEAIRCSFENNYNIRIQNGTKKVSWWNDTLAHLRERLKKAWNRVKNSHGNSHKRQAMEERRCLQRKYNKGPDGIYPML
ncbi:uncharacterized protein LOC107045661 [Diachasma alloeum]|uniref:uncharacterized protein LOC107045661 n=1 Tax=Diachasma alloeum TaxID=454923 RepID=UPI0007385024|nr:uncharacterized protein LOC107045661 [Diachasma alloeum]